MHTLFSVLTLLSTFVYSQDCGQIPFSELHDPIEFSLSNYDYLIIGELHLPIVLTLSDFSHNNRTGGGTAGLALANRYALFECCLWMPSLLICQLLSLTEDASTTVGVLEAGDIHLNDAIIDVPGMMLEYFTCSHVLMRAHQVMSDLPLVIPLTIGIL